MAGSAISEEYDSNEIVHFCEDERSSSLLRKFEPLPSGPKKVVLDHDRDSTMISHDESLDMENPWAKEFCEAPTLEFDEKDSKMSIGLSSLKYHAHSMQLQSQTCLVHRAHTRTTTTLWSSSVKLSKGWL
jgi:hypothetical protein